MVASEGGPVSISSAVVDASADPLPASSAWVALACDGVGSDSGDSISACSVPSTRSTVNLLVSSDRKLPE
jgi:hypothetical protein